VASSERGEEKKGRKRKNVLVNRSCPSRAFLDGGGEGSITPEEKTLKEGEKVGVQ